MKHAWLKEILGDSYTEEQDKKVTDKMGTMFVAKADYDSKVSELGTANTSITDLTGKLKAFDGVDVEKLKKDIDDWETKYNADKAAWDKEKTDRAYMDAVNAQLEGVKFTSNLAKEAIVGKIKEKQLTVENGKLLGFDDFIKGLREQDSGAFVPEENKGGARVNLGGNLNGGSELGNDAFFSAFRNAAGLKSDNE